jgi:hypothetical protein
MWCMEAGRQLFGVLWSKGAVHVILNDSMGGWMDGGREHRKETDEHHVTS